MLLSLAVRDFVIVDDLALELSPGFTVLTDDVVVEIEITDVRDASAHFDMQTYSHLSPGDVVRIKRGADSVTLLHPVGYNFFATLRQKLHWSVMPSSSRS